MLRFGLSTSHPLAACRVRRFTLLAGRLFLSVHHSSIRLKDGARGFPQGRCTPPAILQGVDDTRNGIVSTTAYFAVACAAIPSACSIAIGEATLFGSRFTKADRSIVRKTTCPVILAPKTGTTSSGVQWSSSPGLWRGSTIARKRRRHAFDVKFRVALLVLGGKITASNRVKAEFMPT